jgi:hypothetical protein
MQEYIDEYESSEAFLFAPPAVKENAGPILAAFWKAAETRSHSEPSAWSPSLIEQTLMQDMPRLNLPASAKREIPVLLEGFFGFLKDSGRFPPAGIWREVVSAKQTAFQTGIRADGSVKGETVRKASQEVGRNDPCPCGSGRKYKKCCAELFGD